MMEATGDRLWPVLLMVSALLGGGATLEWYARHSETVASVIHITQSSKSGASSTEEDETARAPEVDRSVPVNDNHAQARVAAKRGELGAALQHFGRTVTAHPDAAPLLSEYGYWLLRGAKAKEAVATLTRAIELAPDAYVTRYNLGVAARKAGDAAASEAAFRATLKVNPAFSPASQALGSLLLRRGAVEESIAVLEAATRSGSNEERAASWVALGRSYLKAGRRPDAVKAFDEAISRAPSLVDTRVRIVQAWLSTGKAEDAKPALEAAELVAKLAPDQAFSHMTLAKARERSQDSGGALDEYRQALELDPTLALALRRMLRITLGRQEFEQARRFAKQLVKLDPEDPEHHFLAGLVAARERHLDDARAFYGAAIEHAKGDYPEAYFNLGLLEKRAGNYDAAVQAYQRAIELRPKYLAAHNNLGLTFSAMGRAADAEERFRAAVAIDAGYAPAWLNLAELSIARDQKEEAVAALGKALEARPDYPAASLMLARLEGDLGRASDGLARAMKVAAAHPRHAEAFQAAASLAEKAGKLTDARSAYEHAITLDPDNVAYLAGRAALLGKAGDLAAARTAYEDVLERAPADRDARLALAELARQSGQLDECLREAERVLEIAAGDARAAELRGLCGRKATN